MRTIPGRRSGPPRAEASPVPAHALPAREAGASLLPAIGIGLLIFAHALDYSTFLVMVLRHGMDMELNPLVVALAQDYGIALLTMAKVAAVLLVAATFMSLSRSRPLVARSVLISGIVLGSFGAYSNLISL